MILEKIVDIIADLTEVDKSKISPETVLATLGVDELTTAQLFMAIEEEYSIEIPDDEELKVGTVQDAVALVEKCSGVKDLV